MTLSKMTKAELIRALQAEQAKVMELTQALSIARHEYRALRARSQCAEPRAERAAQGAGEVVATYTRRDGTPMAKVRTGFNTYVHREVA